MGGRQIDANQMDMLVEEMRKLRLEVVTLQGTVRELRDAVARDGPPKPPEQQTALQPMKVPLHEYPKLYQLWCSYQRHGSHPYTPHGEINDSGSTSSSRPHVPSLPNDAEVPDRPHDAGKGAAEVPGRLCDVADLPCDAHKETQHETEPESEEDPTMQPPKRLRRSQPPGF